MRGLRGVIIGVLAAGLVLGAFVVVANAQISKSAVMRAEARRFECGREVVMVRPSGTAFGKSDPLEDWRDENSGDEFWIEKETGRVRYYSSPGNYGSVKGPIATAAECQSAAEAFVRQVYSDARLAGMRKQAQVQVGGEETVHVLEYIEYVGDVQTFNTIRVEMNDQGRILNCYMVDEDVTVGMKAEVSEDDALASVATKSGFSKWSSKECTLKVALYPGGTQRLVWEIELHTGDASFGSTYWAQVDAQTGQVLQWGVAN